MIFLAAYAMFILMTWGLWRQGWHTAAIIYGLIILVVIVVEAGRHARSIREGR